MIQKLIDAGEKMVSKRETLTLRYAVKLNHTKMVKLLLRTGVGGGQGRRRILNMAQNEGLESMADILTSWKENRLEFSLAPPSS